MLLQVLKNSGGGGGGGGRGGGVDSGLAVFLCHSAPEVPHVINCFSHNPSPS